MILLVETAGPTTNLWLRDAEGNPVPGAHRTWESGRQLSDLLLAKLVEFVESAGSNIQELTGLVIFSGPGSFTSLRIGHATINALADSLAIPVVGARGEDWMTDGIETVKNANASAPAVPFYGSDAHITKPKS